MKRWYLVLSILLLVSGGLVFYTNYERDTVNVTSDLDRRVILDYYAPEIDPFAHHLIVEVETSEVISISETFDGVTNVFFTDDGRGRFTVESGQSILVVLSNPNGAVGTVKTTFYCDSWNYAAYTITGLGIGFFLLWYLQTGEEDIEEL